MFNVYTLYYIILLYVSIVCVFVKKMSEIEYYRSILLRILYTLMLMQSVPFH